VLCRPMRLFCKLQRDCRRQQKLQDGGERERERARERARARAREREKEKERERESKRGREREREREKERARIIGQGRRLIVSFAQMKRTEFGFHEIE
jgi:hypothetical protein